MNIFRSPRTTPLIFLYRFFVCVCFFALSVSAFAKDTSLTAIVLFDSPDGAKYLQMSGVSLNGKTELRVCDNVPKFDKHGYDAMPRVQLAAAMLLDRKADGTLTLASFDATSGATGTPGCVLPNGIKFDKSPEMTPAQAADQAMLTLTIQTAPPAELPLLKPGMQVVFVAAPDAELADYLRARRAHSINFWQDYLKRYPASPHAAQARQEIAGELEQSAETLLAQYSRSSGSPTPQLGLLKQVRATAGQIESVTGNRAAGQKIWQQLHENLDTLIARGRRQLQAFASAQEDHTAGYAHLENAKTLSAEILEITPAYAAAVAFHNDVESAETQVNSTLQSAEGMLMAKRYDDALHSVDPYRGMAGELPRVAAVIDTVYKGHMARAQALAGQGNWDQAATEYRAAVAAKPDSAEAAAAMKNAEAQYAEIFNRRVVEQALADSRMATQKGDPITAYEVLADLPQQQRAQVADRMESLKRDYVTAASRQAMKLQEVHLPIRGRADEKAVCQAYDLLQHASTLSNDPALKLKLDLLSEKLGAYYLDQARRYLQRPLGSGAGLGWLYLTEAQRYQPDLDAVKDEMARYQPAYQLRGRLSIGVVVRDQTSRRDNPGFADQLGDAIANALESSGQPVKVVRRYSEDADKVQPDFVLVAEILQHRLVKNSNLETLPSKYRAGTHEVKNEKWTAANDALNQAQQELVQAQHAFADAQQRRVKADIKTATDNVAAVQQKIDTLRKQLESTEQTRAEGVVEPYNYTRRTIDLAGTVELAFRLSDDAGAVIDSNPSLKREDHKSAIILENVKPEDTEGVTAINTPPDEVQFLTDLELQTRDALLKSIKDKAAHLPEKVLEQARQRSQQQDLEGAAADYIVFLNATSDNRSAERSEAATFLRDHFNIAVPAQTPVRQAQARQPGQ